MHGSAIAGIRVAELLVAVYSRESGLIPTVPRQLCHNGFKCAIASPLAHGKPARTHHV